MSFLTGQRIKSELEAGRITISPFIEKHLNPNSYDVTLGNTLLTYKSPQDLFPWPLDVAEKNETTEIPIPLRGIILQPGILYLGGTVERIGSKYFVSIIEGKSSLGRLGFTAHITAGFIDCGFLGNLTLEITVVHPLRIYRGMRVGQICFSEISGDVELYKGKYQGNDKVEPSRSWQDFAPEDAA